MGTSQQVKAANHDRIVTAASRLIRERGTVNVSVVVVMNAVSLTHGGFYAHFANRDELIEQATRRAFADGVALFETLLTKHPVGGIEGFIDVYLSQLHVANRSHGCAVAALTGDFARSELPLRAVVDTEFGRYVDRLIEITAEGFTKSEASAILCALAGAVAAMRSTGHTTERSDGSVIATGVRSLVMALVDAKRIDATRSRPRRGSAAIHV